MNQLVHIEAADRQLVNAIDAAFAAAARRSGAWLACRVGCIQCCLGPFAITALDALRLKRGLSRLKQTDPERAARLKERAAAYVEAIAPQFPGNAVTGELADEDLLPPKMDDVPCPVLDPQTGACELYEHRPITCRVFGPPVRVQEDVLAACELCYEGAGAEDLAACELQPDPEGEEARLLEQLDHLGKRGLTIVAYALAPARPDAPGDPTRGD